MNTKKFTYIDLFSGCGGLSEGFNSSNKYESLAHVEWESPMVDTLRYRLIKKWKHSQEEAKKKVVHFDIQRTAELLNGNWSKKSIADFGNSNDKNVIEKGLKGIIGRRKVDLIIGGPPCQAYSIAGRAQDKNSMKSDYRNYLFESFVKVVDEFKPNIFFFENVPGLLSACPGGVLVINRIFEAFQNIGYEIRNPNILKKSVYSSCDFGVPQNRKRIIIIGVKSTSKINLEDLYIEINSLTNKSRPKNVFDAIGHLPKYKPLIKQKKINGKNISHKLLNNNFVKFHEARFHNQRDINIFKLWIKNKMNKSTSKKKISFYNEIMDKASNHTKYRNLEWDKPSPTIVAHLNKDGLMFIHPDIKQARSITVKEAALLQTFPNDYAFLGSQGFAYKMIGNAVPPKMAKKLALAISKKI